MGEMMGLLQIEVSQVDADLVITGKAKTKFCRKGGHAFLPGEHVNIYQAHVPGDIKRRKLRSTMIEAVDFIFFDTNGTILLENTLLSEKEACSFAEKAGCSSVKQLFEKIRRMYGLPFQGQLITWL